MGPPIKPKRSECCISLGFGEAAVTPLMAAPCSARSAQAEQRMQEEVMTGGPAHRAARVNSLVMHEQLLLVSACTSQSVLDLYTCTFNMEFLAN